MEFRSGDILFEILLIEENFEKAFVFQKFIDQLPTKFLITHVQSLKQALDQLNEKKFYLIFTHLFLPDSQGLETLLHLQKRANSIPIIVIGNSSEEKLAKEAVHRGAQDYLPQEEMNTSLLQRVIDYAIERQQLQQNLKILSFTDELTSLYNRRGFITLLEQQIALAQRLKKGFFLFLIDLDHLKMINDSFGHNAGDKALISTANCLRASFRHHDILGRLGGDEFGAVAIHAIAESGDYLRERLNKKIEAYNRETQDSFKLSLSIGKVYYDGVGETTTEELLHQADLQLYKEKKLTH
ncbi:MAG: diguanylate cyclase [Chlamydiales bacterium]